MVSARECHEENLIKSASSGNTSLIFKHIRSITGRNDIPTMVTYGNLTAASDYGKATLFNKFFYSVFVHSSFLLPSKDNLPTPVASLGDISITEPDVYTALASLDPSKAHGIDAIGPRILKYCAAALCQPIHHLFMLSLSQHYIPEEWRIHTIIPIFKSGDRSSVLCYRPISLLCSISKVLERIIYNAIVKFTTQYISLTQFGFLKNHSSQQQLLLFLSNFMRPSSSPIDVVYLDFKKAFDSVPHNELLVKLWSFGITGNLWNWFKGYLLNRTQCVRINNAISSSLPVISGVPQGSILGPLLFLIFINDLPVSVTNSHLFLFADDAKCLKQIDNGLPWSEKWNLHFNENKCVLLRYNSRGTYPTRLQTYYINNRCITSKQNHKDLGVLMRTDLSWSDHYDYILSIAYKTMGLLRRLLFKNPYMQEEFSIYH